MSSRKIGGDKDEKIPSLSFRGPGTSPSPRKPPSSRTAKSQRVLGQIKEFNTKRPLLLKPIPDEQKIQIVCDWITNVPPTKFGSWLYRFNVLLQSLAGLQNVAPEIRTLAGVALSRASAILTVYKMPNKYPHWGPFCMDPELAEHPAFARVMVMESARVKPDVEEEGEDLEGAWVIVGNSNLDLVLVDPVERTARQVDNYENILESADMALIKAGMQLEFVTALEQSLRKYSVQRYPCPDSAVNVVVRQGRFRINTEMRDCIEISLGIGTEHDAFQWSARWMSEWRIIIDAQSPNRAALTGDISSDAYSLSYGALRLKQHKRVPTFIRLIDLENIQDFVESIIKAIEKAESETQTAIQQWLCNWHETLWRHVCRDNTYASTQYGPLVLQRQDFASELQTAIKENLNS